MKNYLKVPALVFITCFSLYACKKQNPKPLSCNTCTTCITDVLEVDTLPGFNPNGQGYLKSTYFAKQDTFYGKNNSVAFSTLFRSYSGYYGAKSLSIFIDLDSLMPNNLPNQVSFTHERLVGNTNADSTLLNIKFPNTPLLITPTDSLAFYLLPYGYNVLHYPVLTPAVYSGTILISQAKMADSLIISHSNAFNQATIGVNLFESELRNICFKN